MGYVKTDFRRSSRVQSLNIQKTSIDQSLFLSSRIQDEEKQEARITFCVFRTGPCIYVGKLREFQRKLSP